MTSLKISDLIPHPKNEYFFDDITGERWTEFVKSIKESGVRTPIIVTDNMVVVSGNQRVRACKQLGITVIDAEVRHYASDDEVIKDLIETNLRQRGVICDSEIKAGRRFAELQRIEGNAHGGARDGIRPLKKQSDLASEYGVSETLLKELIRLSKAEPAVQELLESGKISKSSALTMISKLSVNEQRELAKQISNNDGKVTGQELEKMIADRDRRIQELESRKPEVKIVEKKVEVMPDDYAALKKKAREAAAWETDFNNQRAKVGEKQQEIFRLQEEIKKLQEQTVREQSNNDMRTSAIMFATQCKNFIESVGGYVFLSEHLMELPERERKGYQTSAQAVHDWAQVILNNIERSANELLGTRGESLK